MTVCESPLVVDTYSTQADTLKLFLVSGFPVAFGVSVPSSLSAEPSNLYRPKLDCIRGGQSTVAVGYEQNRFERGQDALMIRGSWGSKWEHNGYSWLPVEFIRPRLARDLWKLVKQDWLESTELSCPAVVNRNTNAKKRS
ncbi:C1 family peptidase [Neorhodopirellula lusitana]|uniref:C1 family peptidase n=1 Tax=Neorhodopirellula lusitana TaxID=445327 RepID=UPI0038515B99